MNTIDFRTFQELSKKRSPFTIKTVREGERFHDTKQDLFFFYIRVFLDITEKSSDYLTLDDVEFVKYKLHPTFPEPLRASYDKGNNFEIKIWTYGFFEITATIFLRFGKTIEIKKKLEFQVSSEEIAKNGKDELSW